MYCKVCGKEINGGNFCKHCGAATKKAEIKKYPFVAIITIFFVGILMLVGVTNSGLSEKEARKLLYAGMKVDAPGSFSDYKIVELSNFEINEGDIIDTYYVMADMIAESEKEKVICQVVATIGKEQNEWILIDYSGTNIKDRIPLAGVESATEWVESAVKEHYPEINWGYKESRLLMNDLNYDFPITYTVYSRDTQLEQKKDSFAYEYSFDTYTAHVTGQIEIELTYSIYGEWELETVQVVSDEIEWHLEGVWSFEMYTYYVDATVCGIYEISKEADMMWRGSVFQGAGAVQWGYVPISIEDRCIYFEPFYINENSGGTSSREIILTAKLDDMYFLNAYTGGSYECAVGGKSEEFDLSNL